MPSSKAARRRPRTRFERVKEILDAAVKNGKGAHGRRAKKFWDVSLDELKKASLHGIPLIAPDPEAARAGEAPSRSAASGLIKGLRGEPPFDDSRFPRLPWGGEPVAAEDIQFIADWIDDGCPPRDHLQTIEVGPLKGKPVETARVRDMAEFAASRDAAKRLGHRPGEPRQRLNVDCMSAEQLNELRAAFRKIYDLNSEPENRANYNNQALVHQNHCQHGWERFLPWHRAYLYEFEQNLQDFVPDVTLPYWDWTMPHYRPSEPEQGAIIPKAFQAFLTEDEARGMIGSLDPEPSAKQKRAFMALATGGRTFVSQHRFFCEVVGQIKYRVTPRLSDDNRKHMIDALLASNALWYPLRYPAEYEDGQTIAEYRHYHYPSADDMAQIASINNFRDFGGGSVYNASFGFMDQNPHNTMHIWTGGQNPDAGQGEYACKDERAARARGAGRAGRMESAEQAERAERANSFPVTPRNFAVQITNRSFHRRKDLYSQPPLGDMFSNLTASYDPIFWPIHVNVDRLWWEWQARNPSSLPYDLDAVLTPWSYTVRDMLDISRFGYEYVRSSFVMPVGLEAPIGRFVSTPIKIDAMIKPFRKAEIRLHRVPQLMRSCFVRVFLNQPKAGAATPVRDNPHYAGYIAIFGEGTGYDGPGDGRLPPPRPRAFDQRPRRPDMARYHRIDVTDCVRRLLKRNAELQITLVVIGADYREEPDLLRLEGVSLNFLD